MLSAKIAALFVMKEVAQFVVVDSTLKTIAQRGQKETKTMFTNSDFAKLAAAKKAQKVATAVTATAEKVKSIADAAKDAVAAAFPASNKALDERTEQILTLHASLEQRVESLEDATGVQTIVNTQKAVERAGGLLAQMKARKEKQAKQAEVKPAAEPVVEEVKEEKPKPVVRTRRPAPVKQAEPVQEEVQEQPKPAGAKKTRLRLNDTPKN